MGSLYRYSALITKLRAKKSRLLSDEDFSSLASSVSLPDFFRALKQFPRYASILENERPENLRRDDLERKLIAYQFKEFSSLYLFADREQRGFFKLEILRYEALLLKRFLRTLFGHVKNFDPKPFGPFFEKHGKIDFSALSHANHLTEAHALLRQSAYGPLFESLSLRTSLTLYDCEHALDLYCFELLRTQAERLLKGKDKKTVLSGLEDKISILNSQWIRRANKYYEMDDASLRALLIPAKTKKQQREIEALLSRNPEEIKLVPQLILSAHEIRAAKKEPYSFAPLIAYLHAQELETKRIISIMEAIRYGLSAERIKEIVLPPKDRRTLA